MTRFDVSSVPAGSAVGSATLELYVSDLAVGKAGRPITVHLVTAGWAEGQISWYWRDGVGAWSWAGGDYDLAALASVAVESLTAGGWVSFDVTSALQSWVNDPSSNHGFLIKQSENNTGSTFENRVHFAESEDPSTGIRPRLVVTYTPPSGPAFTQQPQDVAVRVGSPASFSVSATGTGTLTYQWQEYVASSWQAMGGETASTFVISSTVASDNGRRFRCVVTDTVGSAWSSSAAVGAYSVRHVKPGGTGDGSSWANAFGNPQDALAVAQAGDEIWVAEGTYKPTSGTSRSISFALVESVALYGGFAGTETLRDQRDAAAHVTVLSGDIGAAGTSGDNSYRVVTGASNATLDGFTVTGGNTTGSGAGMYNYGVTRLTVADCKFSGNSAGYGGGMYNGWYPSLVVTGCVFSGNSGTRGGGMYGDRASIDVTNCAFLGNGASSYGGAMYNSNQSSPAVTNCVFSGNAAGVSGGAIINYSSCSPAVTGCTFSANTAGFAGGAVYNYYSSPTFTNSILWGDSAPTGPEIYESGNLCAVSYSDVEGGWAGAGNVDAPPLFMDADGADDVAGTPDDDLRLQARSACIDAADGDVASPTDIEGNARWDDTGTADLGAGAPTYVDMGAYEFQGTTTGTWVTVRSPAAGALARAGAGFDIRWSASADVSDVEIELSRDGGTTWEQIAASTPSDGSHSWTVTDGGGALPQQDCLVRISDAADGVPGGTSGSFGIFDGVCFVDADAPGPAHDGLSWATAFAHPQDAADAVSGGSEIRVAEGVYVRRGASERVVLALKDGVATYGGYAGYGLPDPDQRDPAGHVTTLDGQNIAYHVVVGASNATLDGFTVTGGNAACGSPCDWGAGMYNEKVSSLTVANCDFSNNSGRVGGGMSNWNCSPAVTSCTFSGNAATSSGGGMYNYYISSPAITNCTFAGNSATYDGGAVYNYYRSSPTVTDCTFAGNAGRSGGGIYNYYRCSPDVANCTFTGNSASYYGGALYSFYTCSPVVTNCTFAGNLASGSGGAMYSDNNSSPVVINSILWGDSAPTAVEIYTGLNSSCTVSYSDVGQVGGFTDGGGNVNADPLFVDLDGADGVQGTPDDDLRLQPASPCIDAADGDAAPGSDRDGNPRCDDPGVVDTGTGAVSGITYADMGAFEFQPLAMPEITVTSPNGGEGWVAGTSRDVTWLSAGVTDVKIELSRDGGLTWESMIATTPAAAGSYSWTLTGPASADCLVRVSDASAPATADTSDAAFVISSVAGITVSPVSGLVTTESGATATFTVVLDGQPTAGVTIELSSSDTTEGTLVGVAGNVLTLTFTAPNWDVPRTVTVTGAEDAVIDGDAAYTIVTAPATSLDASYDGLDPADVAVTNADNDGGTFTDIGAPLAGVGSYESSLAWGDYDNDGDLDLAVVGSSSGGPVSRIYRNEAGTFTDIAAGLTGVRLSSLAWGDYDNDGDLDFVLAGYDGGNQLTRLYRNDGGTFTDTGAGLTSVQVCALAWGDYDNDGDLDLALAGLPTGGGRVSKVYRNDAGTFRDIGAGLTGVQAGSLAWGDYDNDGDLDLALAGADSSSVRLSKVYRNDGGTFTDTGAGLTGIYMGSLAWGDYDNDGDLDLALAGYGTSKVYRNDGGTFTDISAGLTSVSWSSVAWGDYDNDGDLDLALAGLSSSGSVSKVYRNDAGTFTDIGAGLTGVYSCSVAWGDYDNDGDLDLALAGDTGSGYVSKIYRNDGGVSNTPPAAPGGLGATYTGAGPYEVTFSWADSADAETPPVGLSYNLRVGMTSGGDEVFSGMADVTTGWRRIPARGVVQPGLSVNEWTLTLPAGMYCWSVQAVDTGLVGSSWAAEETLVVPMVTTQTITVTLPAFATEGDGVLIGAGTVSIPGMWPTDLVIDLQSNDASELTVPATVTIFGGDTSATFDLTIIDDGRIDGTETVAVTAALAGWTGVPDSMYVLDNETQSLTVTVPAGATEGDGVLVGAGTVSIQGTWPVDLVVSLQSSDTTKLTVPATVTILGGSTSAAFDITVLDDDTCDQTLTVTAMATRAGWTPGYADMNILDDDPPAIIPSGHGCSPAGSGHASGLPTPAWLVSLLILAGLRAASWGRSRASAGRDSTRKQFR